MTTYILYSTLGLGLSFFMYQWFLRNGKTFVFNRYYLLITIVLCLLSPLLQLKTSYESPLPLELSASKLIAEKQLIEENLESVTIETMSSSGILSGLLFLLWTVYLVVSLLFTIRFFRNLIQISREAQKPGPVVQGLKLILLQRNTVPYSYFNCLFMSEEQYKKGKLTATILAHERAHSRQLHTLDVVFVEFICCFFWFNPFLWLYKKAISENHEFLADQQVIKEGANTNDYSNEIVQFISKSGLSPLVSGFSYLQTKKRIIMLHKRNSNTFIKAIKMTCVSILFGGLFILTACTHEEETKPLVVVIDAGHGGKDAGVTDGGLDEKEITLAISKKLKTYSENSKIKFLFTRTDDQFMTLQERVNYINQQQPDLFISLHVNNSDNEGVKGVEAYYYEGNFGQQSMMFGKELVTKQLQTFSRRGEIKTASFTILKNTNCPGVLLELGFLSNTTDRNILVNAEKQDQIVASIYQSLVDISKL